MQPNNPLEAGVYGATGTYPISDGTTDRFSAIAGYLQRDPRHGIPGIFVVYQTTHDAYPFAGATSAANGRDYTVDVYEPVYKDKIVVGFRREMTDDGMGTISNYANVDATFTIARYLRLYTEAAFSATNPGNAVNAIGTPAWRAYIWWSPPLLRTK